MSELKMEIIERVRNGDEHAFEEIYLHYRKIIYYMAITHLHSESDAEDIVQDIFIELQKCIANITSPKALTVWINKATYTRCLNVLRNRTNRREDNKEDIENIESLENDVIEVINKKFINEVIIDSLLKMNHKLKIVGLLRFYEELSLEDISEIMEIPVGTVKSRLHQVKNKLKEDLKDYGFHKATCIVFLMPGNLKYLYSLITKQNKESYVIKPSKYCHGTTKGVVILSSIACTVTGISFAKDTSITPSYTIEYTTTYVNKSLNLKVQTESPFTEILVNGKSATTIEKNGTYNITIRNENDEVYETTIEVTNIDKESPQMVSSTINRNDVAIVVKDYLSGIEPSTIRCTDSKGNVVKTNYNSSSGMITFQTKESLNYSINVTDKANNLLHINLNEKRKVTYE